MLNKKDLKVFIPLALLAMSSTGVIANCAGVFYNVLSETLNVTRGSVAFYVTINSMISSIINMFVPKIVNKKNYKKIILFANTLGAFSLMMIGQAKSLSVIYLFAIGLGIGFAFTSNSIINLLMINNFKNDVGKYSSLIYTFSGIIGIGLSPILTSIIENYSYSLAYIISGCLSILFALPIQFSDLNADFPKDDKNKTIVLDETSSTDRIVFVLYLIMSWTFYMTSNFPQHVIGYSALKGFNSMEGSYLLSAAMAGNVVFKPINGILTDKIGGVRTSRIIILTNLCGMLLIISTNVYPLLIFGYFIYGANYTMSSFMHALLCRELFHDKYYSTYPKMMLSGAISNAVATTLIASCYDFTGNYNIAIIVIICYDIFNLIALTYLKKNRKTVSLNVN